MRYFKGCVADFSCLFAEDSAEQSFLSRKLGFALRSYLTYEDVVCSDFGTLLYDTVGVKVFQRVFAYVRNFTCDFFRTELCVARFV